MSRVLGTISRGIRLPIIKAGTQDLDKIILEALNKASIEANTSFRNKDIICITESLVARCEENYVSIDDIAQEIIEIFGEDATVGVLYPIYSRNRFSMILKGIARGAKKVIIQLTEGKDEVGNDLINPFTNIDIEKFYKEIVENENAECEIIKSKNIFEITKHTKDIIVATIHTRYNDYRAISITNPHKVITLDKLCIDPYTTYKNDKAGVRHGYNTQYGVLGSNKATEETLKLFPRRETCQKLCESLKAAIKEEFNADVEVMIYGDGCFKDPIGGIWEFADPVVSPYFTEGLNGTPNELKIKYLTDNENLDSQGIKDRIMTKDSNLVGNMLSEGTTPRRYTDLIGSLADLTSGSGDKGTPIIWISGYFDNYTSEY